MTGRYGNYTKIEALRELKEKITFKMINNLEGNEVKLLSLHDSSKIQVDLPGYVIFPEGVIYPIVNGVGHHSEFKNILSAYYEKTLSKLGFSEAFELLFQLNCVIYVGLRRDKEEDPACNLGKDVMIHFPNSFEDLTDFQKMAIIELQNANDLECTFQYSHRGFPYEKSEIVENSIEQFKNSLKNAEKVKNMLTN